MAEEYVCAVGVRPDEQCGSREALENLISFALAVLDLVQRSQEAYISLRLSIFHHLSSSFFILCLYIMSIYIYVIPMLQ